MSGLLLQIGNLPSSQFTFTNRVYISPRTFQNLFNKDANNHPEHESSPIEEPPLVIFESRVYAVEADNFVPMGQVALSDLQRHQAHFRLGTKVEVKSYSPSPECALAGLEFHVNLMTKRTSDGKRKVMATEIDTNYLVSNVINDFEGYVIALGQVLVTDFEGMEVELTVASFEFMAPVSERRGESKLNDDTITIGSIGQLLSQTDVRFRNGRGKRRVILTGSNIAGSIFASCPISSIFLGKGKVRKLTRRTKSKLAPPPSPCAPTQSFDVSDSDEPSYTENLAVSVTEKDLIINKKDSQKFRKPTDCQELRKDCQEFRKPKDLTELYKTMSFRITLKSLGGIIMSKSIIKRGKDQKELPIFAVLSYPSEPLNPKTSTWSNIPSAPLKTSKSSIGNRESYYTNFLLKQTEHYGIRFAFPMKKKRTGSENEYTPQEIDLRLGLMRGTEVIAAGTITIVFNGTEKDDLQNIPVKNCKRKKSGKGKVVKAGSFQSDPNKKYSLQRSFLRVVVDADPTDEGNGMVSILRKTSHISSSNLSFLSRYTENIPQLVKHNPIWPSISTSESANIFKSQQKYHKRIRQDLDDNDAHHTIGDKSQTLSMTFSEENESIISTQYANLNFSDESLSFDSESDCESRNGSANSSLYSYNSETDVSLSGISVRTDLSGNGSDLSGYYNDYYKK